MRSQVKPGNVVDGWWIVDRFYEIVDGRKRGWVSVVCPGCDEVVEKRTDHLKRQKVCPTCEDGPERHQARLAASWAERRRRHGSSGVSYA